MPMIYFAEDGSESWHKLYRINMTKHARQTSRSNRILDVYNRAICTTDPKIVLISKKIIIMKSRNTAIDISEFMEEG